MVCFFLDSQECKSQDITSFSGVESLHICFLCLLLYQSCPRHLKEANKNKKNFSKEDSSLRERESSAFLLSTHEVQFLGVKEQKGAEGAGENRTRHLFIYYHVKCVVLVWNMADA